MVFLQFVDYALQSFWKLKTIATTYIEIFVFYLVGMLDDRSSRDSWFGFNLHRIDF